MRFRINSNGPENPSRCFDKERRSMEMTDAQWLAVKHLFPDAAARRTTGRPGTSSRTVLEAILWIERTGERWIYLPAYFPPQQTCYAKYLLWKKSGVLAEVTACLAEFEAQHASTEVTT
jgi:transposase